MFLQRFGLCRLRWRGGLRVRLFIGILALLLCVSTGAFAQPHQTGEDEGSGCPTGHLVVTPGYTPPGACGGPFMGDRTVYMNATSDPYQVVIGGIWYHPTVNCLGTDIWVDVHLDRFNVKGVARVFGYLQYDPNKITFGGFHNAPEFMTSTYAELHSPGYVEVTGYANPPYWDASNAREVIIRLLFVGYTNASPITLSWYDLNLYTHEPCPTPEDPDRECEVEIPPAEYCQYPSTITRVQ